MSSAARAVKKFQPARGLGGAMDVFAAPCDELGIAPHRATADGTLAVNVI